jgi:hypothetical protein
MSGAGVNNYVVNDVGVCVEYDMAMETFATIIEQT